jgi:hypothetical protein
MHAPCEPRIRMGGCLATGARERRSHQRSGPATYLPTPRNRDAHPSPAFEPALAVRMPRRQLRNLRWSDCLDRGRARDPVARILHTGRGPARTDASTRSHEPASGRPPHLRAGHPPARRRTSVASRGVVRCPTPPLTLSVARGECCKCEMTSRPYGEALTGSSRPRPPASRPAAGTRARRLRAAWQIHRERRVMNVADPVILGELGLLPAVLEAGRTGRPQRDLHRRGLSSGRRGSARMARCGAEERARMSARASGRRTATSEP